MKKTVYLLTIDAKKLIYNFNVNSYLTYLAPFIGITSQHNLNKLQIAQKKIKTLCMKNRIPTSNIYLKTKFLNIKYIIHYESITFI